MFLFDLNVFMDDGAVIFRTLTDEYLIRPPDDLHSVFIGRKLLYRLMQLGKVLLPIIRIKETAADSLFLSRA